MTRVEEERAQQRYDEQKRLEKELNAKNKQQGDDFKSVVNAKQSNAGRIARGDQVKQDMSRNQQQTGQRQRSSSMLTARAGIASRDLQAELMKRGQMSGDHKRIEEKERKDDLHDRKAMDRAAQVSSQQDADAKVDKQNERLAAISRDDEQRGGGDQDQGDGGGMQGGQMGMPMQQPQVSAPAEAKGAAGAPRIPANALNEIVKRCLAGVNTKGMNEFQIDLKDGVLGGATVKVTSNGRKVSTTFVAGDANIRRLLKASEGDLARAFDKSGLSLEKFTVSAF